MIFFTSCKAALALNVGDDSLVHIDNNKPILIKLLSQDKKLNK